MTALTWDGVGERLYETGIDHGVLYIPDEDGVYNNGVAWNGLTSISEKPSGAEPNAQFADNIKYLNLFSAEEFGATVEAFTYPDEFAQFDGIATPTPGVHVGQQARGSFGLSYRTKVGNDIEGDDLGYKLHLIYGATASPSEKAYNTINDSPEAIAFSWEITTIPVLVSGLKPTSIVVIDSTKVDPDDLAALELILYGTIGVDPALPLPAVVVAMFTGGVTEVTAVNAPTYNAGTHVVTIVATTGIVYVNEDTEEVLVAGAQPALGVGEHLFVKARPASGYVIAAGQDDDWLFNY